MKAEVFNELVKSSLDNCESTLIRKGQEYASDGDRLHNFRISAELQDITIPKSILGMMTKHTVSVYDMVNSGESFSSFDWDEKIGDLINYLLILRAAVAEENTVA